MHPFVYVVVGGFLVVGTVWWRHQVKLMRHQGVSREEFVRHFQGVGIADVVSGAVYDHFRQMTGVKDYQPAPTDSFEETFKMSGEDLDDELEELLPKLALDMPHSGILREWNEPLETVADVVRWIDWVRTRKAPRGAKGQRAKGQGVGLIRRDGDFDQSCRRLCHVGDFRRFDGTKDVRMPRNQRCVMPGQAYHITQRGTNRQKVFFTDADRSTYLKLMSQNLEDAGVRVLGWCLMRNHVHFVAVAERDDSLSVLMRRVHGRFAQMMNARLLRSGHLWQNRFYSCALSPTHLWRALVYVERNPVRAGLVARPEEYKWSSAAAHLGLAKDRYSLLDNEFWAEQGGADGWAELLGTPEEALELRLLRRCTYAGRPFGEKEYVAMFEEEFGRVWREWGFEKEREVRRFAG